MALEFASVACPAQPGIGVAGPNQAIHDSNQGAVAAAFAELTLKVMESRQKILSKAAEVLNKRDSTCRVLAGDTHEMKDVGVADRD